MHPFLSVRLGQSLAETAAHVDLNGVAAFAGLTEYSSCSVYLYEDLNVIEDRLYQRFIGSNPTPEGLARFNARKELNIADALILSDHAKNFYAFLKNEGSIRETADAVLSAFARFTEGQPASLEANLAVTEALAAEARAKA